MSTVSADEVDGFINGGVSEVNLVRPVEALDDITPIADTYSYATSVEDPFRLEQFRDSVFLRSLQRNEDDDSAQGGWETWGGDLLLPKSVVDQSEPTTDFWRLWGYTYRAKLVDDSDVLDGGGLIVEMAIKMYARWQFFQTMLYDRALFKQWQAASQNTDMTPNQLQQDVALYLSEWNRHRNRIRVVRRS